MKLFYVQVRSSDGTVYVEDSRGISASEDFAEAFFFKSHDEAAAIARKWHSPGSEETHGPEDGHYASVKELKKI